MAVAIMSDEDPHLSIADHLTHHLAGRIVVLFSTHASDTAVWHQLLRKAGTQQALVLTFDDAPLRHLIAQSLVRGATDLLSRQHGLIATLGQPSTLSRLVDQFDPGGQARLVFTDPLNPPAWGGRRQFGAKHPSWRLFEHKATVDTLWDAMGIRRAETVVFDHPARLPMGDFAFATGTVWACQRRGSGPTAGADGIRWSQSPSPPAGLDVAVPQRIRAMPLLPGRSCRLHGLVFANGVAVFPPLELVVLSRPDTGTFLCAGSVPLAGHAGLSQLTTTIGRGLRDQLAYRGGFAVDGILGPEGFLPTDLNTRLTSAFEAADPEVRVALHAANLLARLDDNTGLATACVRLASRAIEEGPEITLFGATQERPARASGQQPVQWRDGQLRPVTNEHTKDGVLSISPSPRGWTVTAVLRRQSISANMSAALAALEAFRASDTAFGTQFGRLDIPGGVAETFYDRSPKTPVRATWPTPPAGAPTSAPGPAPAETQTMATQPYDR